MSLREMRDNPGLYRDDATGRVVNIKDFTEMILEFPFQHEGAHYIGKGAQVFLTDIYCLRHFEPYGKAHVELFLNNCSKFSAPLAALVLKQTDGVEQRLLRLEAEVFKVPGVYQEGLLHTQISTSREDKLFLRFEGESREAAGTLVYVKTLQRKLIS